MLHETMNAVRKVSTMVTVLLVLFLAGCTSTTLHDGVGGTAPSLARTARAAAAAAIKAEAAAKAAALAAQQAATAAENAARAVKAMSATNSCTPSQLVVELGPSDAAMGHIGQVVTFTNVSAVTCSLEGYPSMQMFDAAGLAIPTEVTDGASYTVPAMPARVVFLTGGSEASFDVGYSDATGYGTAVCPNSVQVAITPPDASRSITVSWRIQPYGGSTIAKLQCGQIAVSPVYAGGGTSAPG